jgi:hypothetical protein
LTYSKMAPGVVTGSSPEAGLPSSKMAGATEASRGTREPGATLPSPKMAASVGPVRAPPRAGPASPSSLSPPPRPIASSPKCSRQESGLLVLDMAAVAATAATKGHEGGSGRAGASKASGMRKRKGPGPLATACLVIYNVVMTAG